MEQTALGFTKVQLRKGPAVERVQTAIPQVVLTTVFVVTWSAFCPETS